jgi:membrane-bound lytic murein transglycosylase D
MLQTFGSILVLMSLCLFHRNRCVGQTFESLMNERLYQSERQWQVQNLLHNSPQLFSTAVDLPELMDTLSVLRWSIYKWELLATERELFNELLCPKSRTERLLILSSLLDLYQPLFRKSIEQHQIDKKITYLPLLLSGMNPHYGSADGPTGLWGLDYLSGRKCHLNINAHYDERRGGDFTTHAACKLIKQYFDQFQDPLLATLAYIHGAGQAQEIAKKPTHQWPEIWLLELKFLCYIELVFQNLRVSQYQSYYFDAMAHFVPIALKDTVSLTALDSLLGENISDLRGFNPTITGNYLLSDHKKVPYYLSHSSAQMWIKMEDTLYKWKVQPTEKKMSPIAIHRVKRGESLGSIAKKYHISITALKTSNNLRKNTIRQGQKLIIPDQMNSPSPINENTNGQERNPPTSAPHEEIYIVKPGDSLWKIARQYRGVTEEDLKRWNRCGDQIKPGQKLKIFRS